MKLPKFKYNLTIIIVILVFIFIGTLFIPASTKNETSHFNTEFGNIRCFSKDTTICQSFANETYFEKHIGELMKQYYKPNTVFLDIGANYGLHTLIIGKHIKDIRCSGKIYSFECQPTIFTLLSENVQSNQLEDIVQLNHFGLGDKKENKKMNVPKDYNTNGNPGGLSIKNEHTDDTTETIDIQINTLDSLHIDNISLIKLDVEGYELEVLEGAKATIEKCKPVIFIEIWQHHKDSYFDWLNKNIHYKLHKHIGADDYIFVHNSYA